MLMPLPWECFFPPEYGGPLINLDFVGSKCCHGCHAWTSQKDQVYQCRSGSQGWTWYLKYLLGLQSSFSCCVLSECLSVCSCYCNIWFQNQREEGCCLWGSSCECGLYPHHVLYLSCEVCHLTLVSGIVRFLLANYAVYHLCLNVG